MDECQLYKLPRELLVKLITTLERDIRNSEIAPLEQRFQMVQKELEMYYILCTDVEVETCIGDNCIAYRGFNGHKEIITHCHAFYFCDFCGELMCNKHTYTRPVEDGAEYKLCPQCKDREI